MYTRTLRKIWQKECVPHCNIVCYCFTKIFNIFLYYLIDYNPKKLSLYCPIQGHANYLGIAFLQHIARYRKNCFTKINDSLFALKHSEICFFTTHNEVRFVMSLSEKSQLVSSASTTGAHYRGPRLNYLNAFISRNY